MESVCRLCSTPQELCWSHIIPEFLYRPLYDEKHRFFVVAEGVERNRYEQRGLTEKLLCQACEQHLAVYEKYAAEVMTGKLGHKYEKRGSRIVIRGLDYKRVKLFQLSVLWRGAVSSLEFFRLVNLGSHEGRLRQMLLNKNPGEVHDFGCAVIFATERGEEIGDTFFNPEPLRWLRRRMIKFFFAGSAWIFHCDRRPAPPYLQDLFLQRDGTLIGLTADLAEARKYGAVAKRIARRMRL